MKGTFPSLSPSIFFPLVGYLTPHCYSGSQQVVDSPSRGRARDTQEFVFQSTGDRVQRGWVIQGLANAHTEYGFLLHSLDGSIAGFYKGEQWDQSFNLEIVLWQHYRAQIEEGTCSILSPNTLRWALWFLAFHATLKWWGFLHCPLFFQEFPYKRSKYTKDQ